MNPERTPASVVIGGRAVGRGHPCFVIAEAGVNHNGDPALAHRLIDVAADSGADAVKFQTFRAEALVTRSAPKAAYQRETTDAGESQLEMLRRLELSPELHTDLMRHCQERGILFLSTPFEEESADLLERLGVPAFKIPSGEITNLPFLAHVARKRLPMIVSTGMSTMDEVTAAVETIRSEECDQIALLHCVSAYPADPAEANLRAMETLSRKFSVPGGFSDHTEGNTVALASVALGASIVEKHFTLDRSLPGPDNRASIGPDELAALVSGIRVVESALGDGAKLRTEGERDTARVARKSLVAAVDISAGTVLTRDLIAIRRPGTGLAPDRLESVLGRHLKVDLPEGTPISPEAIA
jgi:N,N'-diacetyllegionaminate synthase